MTKILLVTDRAEDKRDWFIYLCDCLSTEPNFKTSGHEHIWVKDFYIQIMNGSSRSPYWMGQRPRYHYGYGAEMNNYLLMTGSERLVDLASVIEIIKEKRLPEEGECFEGIRSGIEKSISNITGVPKTILFGSESEKE